MGSGKRPRGVCPFCEATTRQPEKGAWGHEKEDLPHESPFECIIALRSRIEMAESRMEDKIG